MDMSRILWSDGLVLNHQLFQAHDIAQEQQHVLMTRALHAYPFGVRRCAFLHADREVDRAEVAALDVVMPCGTTVRSPGTDALPPALPFGGVPPDVDTLLVGIALPPWRQDGGNCLTAGSEPTRFVSGEAWVPDIYGDGSKVPIHFARLRPQLVLITDESRDTHALPVARYVRGPGGGFHFDRSFMSPALAVRDCIPLQDRLVQLLNALHGKMATLTAAQAEPVRDSVAYRSGDHATFWMLHTLGVGAAALMHLKDLPVASPERLFQEMLRVAGGLQAFRRTDAQKLLPAYDHRRCDNSFRLLFDLMAQLIDTAIPTRFVAIPLLEDRASYFVGTWDTDQIDADMMLYLALHSDTAEPDLVDTVPRRFKLGAPDDVDKAVNSALPCVPLKHAPHPPPALPARPGHVYFALDRTAVTCKRMLGSKTITLFVPDGLPQLKMELFAVHE